MRVSVKSKSFFSRVSVFGHWTTSVFRMWFCVLSKNQSRFLYAKRDTERERERDKERVFQSQKTKRVITWEKREPSRLGREPFSSDPLELVSWFVPIFFFFAFSYVFCVFGDYTLFEFCVCEIGLFENLGFLNWEWWWGVVLFAGFFWKKKLVLFFSCGDKWSGLWGWWNLYLGKFCLI